jgi:hypothetical protein
VASRNGAADRGRSRRDGPSHRSRGGQAPAGNREPEQRWDALLENLEQQHIVIRLDPVRLVVVMPVAAMIVSVPMAVVMASAAEQQDAGDID